MSYNKSNLTMHQVINIIPSLLLVVYPAASCSQYMYERYEAARPPKSYNYVSPLNACLSKIYAPHFLCKLFFTCDHITFDMNNLRLSPILC